MKQYVMGLDNGGTVTKAALFDLEGHELCVASGKTQSLSPAPGYNERDMDTVWETNCECIREVLKKSAVAPSQVKALAVCGHGKGLYLWGRNGRPAFNGISSTDNRAWKVVQEWYNTPVFSRVYPKICQQLLACQQAALLRWMKENEPRVYENIRWVFSVKDYIRFRLTGEAWCEATDISGSGLMDVRRGCYDPELLKTLGIEEMYDCLAPVKYSGELCGAITRDAAKKTGLAVGTPVAGGMFDIDACAIAMAVTKPEQLCTITGTWSINEFISSAPVTGTDIAMNSLYAIPGFYLLEECSATSAGNLDWVIKNCVNTQGRRGDSLYDWLGAQAESVPANSSDIYYLPFLYGSNAHALAKGGFIGMTNYHSNAHMIRAVYEGVAFSHKTHIDRLLSVRQAPQTIRMGGGAVNSPFWVQMFADVLGYPVETVRGVRELGALGSAMSGAVACGVYKDYVEAAEAMVRVEALVEPNEKMFEIYREKYEKYKAIIQALDGVWGRFAV